MGSRPALARCLLQEARRWGVAHSLMQNSPAQWGRRHAAGQEVGQPPPRACKAKHHTPLHASSDTIQALTATWQLQLNCTRHQHLAQHLEYCRVPPDLPPGRPPAAAAASATPPSAERSAPAAQWQALFVVAKLSDRETPRRTAPLHPPRPSTAAPAGLATSWRRRSQRRRSQGGGAPRSLVAHLLPPWPAAGTDEALLLRPPAARQEGSRPAAALPPPSRRPPHECGAAACLSRAAAEGRWRGTCAAAAAEGGAAAAGAARPPSPP